MRPVPELTRDLDRRARGAARRAARAAAPANRRAAAELAELRAEINFLYRLVESQGAELAPPQAGGPAPTETRESSLRPGGRVLVGSETHVLFKPAGARGYQLIEGEGAFPAQGETVEIDDRRFIVTRLGRSPLPGDRRVCAYLQAE